MPPRPQDFNNLYLVASHGFCSARGYRAGRLIRRGREWRRPFVPKALQRCRCARGHPACHGRLGNKMNKYGENLVQMRAAAQRAELERREQEHRRREQQHQRQQGRPGPSEQDNQHGQSGQDGQNGRQGQQGQEQEPQRRRRGLRQRIRRVRWASPLGWGSWTPPPTPQDRQDQNRLDQHGQRHPPPGNGEDGQATANSGTPSPAALQAVSEEEDTLYRAVERTIDKLYDICPVGLLSHDEDNDVSMHDGDVINGNAGMNGNGGIGGSMVPVAGM